MDDDDNEPSAPALLLPFYVNGTLSAEEHARVESALAVDPELRAELEVVREIAALVREGGAELTLQAGAAPERLEALTERLGEQVPRASDAQVGLRAPLTRRSGLGRLLPRPSQAAWKPAFAAAAVLVVVQAGLLATLTRPETDYGVLSGPETVAPAEPQRLLVRLTPGARWAEIKALLASEDLTIVGGPRGDVIDLAVGDGVKPEDEVRRLRASPLVEFVGPQS
ncbi:anti-sigma factor family protein [Phenylobacterium sp.]|uniref:anti-sigma factor family protein n=1 Tax=Phenylobacterium sp. TaxID=1871053 RepID=UPI003BA9DF96